MIDQAFWSDPDIEKQPAGAKLCALWLITNSQTSLLGLCGASESRFTFETGLPAKALTRALEALPRAFKRCGDTIFVRNYIRHQFGVGEKLMKNNFFVALRSLFLSVKDEKLKALILSEYPEFKEGLNKPLPRASQVQGKEREGKGRLEQQRSIEENFLRVMFKRRESLSLSEKERVSLLKLAGQILIPDLEIIDKYYATERPKGKDGIHRRDMDAFLNNYHGELDRAREWEARVMRKHKSLNGHAPKLTVVPDDGLTDEQRLARIKEQGDLFRKQMGRA